MDSRENGIIRDCAADLCRDGACHRSIHCLSACPMWRDRNKEKNENIIDAIA